jgi:hypothetical protein
MQFKPNLAGLLRGATLAILMGLGVVFAGPFIPVLLIPTQFGYLHGGMEWVQVRFEGAVIGGFMGLLVHVAIWNRKSH